jgi:hypothetical protein
MSKYEHEIALILLGDLQRSLEAAEALDRARGVTLWVDRVKTLVIMMEDELKIIPQAHVDGLRKLDDQIQRMREREQE